MARRDPVPLVCRLARTPPRPGPRPVTTAGPVGRPGPATEAWRRVVLTAGLGLLATLGAIAVGGVPLLAGLGLASVLALGLLPGGSRRYLLRRLLQVVVTVFVAMAIVWLLVHNFPDDSRQDEAGFLPAMVRYGDWLGGLVTGELGYTQYSETVTEGVSRTIPISLQLLAYSQILALLIAVPGSVIGTRFRGRAADLGVRMFGLLGLALPVFVTSILLIFVFAVGGFEVLGFEIGARLLPTGRYRPVGEGLVPHLRSVALPSIALAFTTAATYLVLLRGEMVQQLASPHVELARAKGLPPLRIVRLHTLRPAAPSLVAAVGAQSALVLGNLVIVERIFLLPGFGDYVLVAIGRRDLAAVAGALFVVAAVLAVINLFADAILLAIDPRIGGR